MADLVTLIEYYKYNETLDNIIYNVNERYPEILADNIDEYKTNIIF